MALVFFETAVDNTSLIMMALVPLICLLVLYFAMQRAIRQNAEQLRREFEERLNVMMTKMRLSETPPPEPKAPAVAATPARKLESAPATKPEAISNPVAQEITPEVLLVIAAAVTAYLGKAVRIRSARELYSHENFNAWSQQGRAVIQASHNLAQRGY